RRHTTEISSIKSSVTSCPSWLLLLLPARSVHKAPDTVFQMDSIEVYKQAKGFATELQVRKYLGLMDWRDGIYGLDFYDYEIFNDKIHFITELHLDSAIHNRKRNLRGAPIARICQFELQACAV